MTSQQQQPNNQQQQPNQQPAAAAVAVAAAAAAAVAAAAADNQAQEVVQPEWNAEECDRFSFDDSDRFEEDSLCSWSSEPESLCNNWRGWKRPTTNSNFGIGALKKHDDSLVTTLTELAAKCVASFIPFELVEHVFPPVPEQLQLRIAYWSFPDNEEDIRLYSCLANSSADEFHRGDQLYRNRAVKDPLQIGFHLSATVVGTQPRAQFNVAVTFDRRRISSCNCTCSSAAYWCSHVVAVCLHRIHCPHEVCLRAPVSESLTRLQRDQLQKFAQYLISELPQQILPTAQRLLDELLSSQPTAINTVCGAPDPTAGASANDQTNWYLDEKTLHENIKKILIKFCLPAPMVYSDVNYLTNSAPPAATEWSSLLRPLRGREPEGMWNLLSIVREMYRRCDRNAIRLLEIITEECMACDQILVWWFNTKLSMMAGTGGHSGGKHSNTHSNSNASQHACSSLCDEIVVLWRLASLNPGLAPEERDMLHAQFTAWHLKILDRVQKCRVQSTSYSNKHSQHMRQDAESFTGFKPAIEACYLDWEDYPILGITHTQDTNPMYHCPFTCFKQTESAKSEITNSQVNSSQAVLSANQKHYTYMITDHHNQMKRLYRPYQSSSNGSSNSSSDSVNVRLSAMPIEREDNRSLTSSEEGFCENEDDGIDSGGGGNMVVVSSNPCGNINKKDQTSNKGKAINLISNSNSSNIDSRGDCESPISTNSSSNNSIRCSDSISVNHKKIAGASIEMANEQKISSQIDLNRAQSPKNAASGTSQQAKPIVATVSSSSSSSSFDSGTSKLSTKYDENVENIQDKGEKSNDGNGKEKIVDSKAMAKPLYDDAVPSTSKVTVTQNKATPVAITVAAAPVAVASTSKDVKARKPVDDCVPSTSKGVTAAAANKDQPENEAERRPSKDDSLSSSGSQQSMDEYNIYCYDASKGYQQKLQEQHALEMAKVEQGKKAQVFSNLKPTEDAWDILFARAEGLHAHGHGREACILAVRLAEEMLTHPPQLMIEIPPPVKQRKGKKNTVNPISHQVSVLASATLAKCAFLCTVLAENSEHYHLAFRICLYALEMQRPPASTKPLEVKLANQEADLLALLKRIPLGIQELRVIRERAEQLRDGTLRSRGEALLPIMLASFIFEALVMPSVSGKENRQKAMNQAYRLPSDENLGFEAAVAALGIKANVSEAEHPLLCEGTRRQRGDLALNLLSYYKDEPPRIAKIMEKLLDRDIHTLIKTPLLPSYYSNNPPVRTPASQARRDEHEIAAQYANEYYQNEYGGVGNSGSAGSRPHSSTSAELDIGMNALQISQNYASNPIQGGQPVGPTITNTSTRIKDSRYKGKRAYPSIPNQPSEASAHFMFELAKNVLTKAGGSSSTQLFTQATPNQNMIGPHKTLHMCAFQLGLYALGLHNCVSPNWLSRTYSSHVSWILGQAMEIGAPAISFLIDTWEGHLTPPEAANMADRASRGWDSNMVYPSAELALSVLPHASALNPNEIQTAILQCKDQSDQMLERACIRVENAAKGGGVYPEVLFQVAHYWYELYSKNSPGGEHEHDDNMAQLDHNMQLGSLIEHHEMPPPQQQHHPAEQQQQQQQQPPPQMPPGTSSQMVVPQPPPPQFQQSVTPVGVPHYVPYSFPSCQGIYHHHNITYPHNQMQMYISAPPQGFQYPPPNHGNSQQPAPPFSVPMPHPPMPPQGGYPMPCAPNVQPFMMPPQQPHNQPPPPNNVPMQPNMQFFGPPPPNGNPQGAPPMNMPQGPPQPMPNMRNQPQPGPPQPGMHPSPNQPNQHGPHHGPMMYPPYVQQGPHAAPPLPTRQRHPLHYNQTQLRYLMAAYNVGMLAMETLARRVHDDRPQAKYARNPPYGDDVKWLLQVSKKLGTQYLHQFCVCAVNSIVSPFVLHDVAIESAHYLGRNNPTMAMQHLRSALTPLVQKCQQMYIQCIHQKLYHLTPSDYEDFANIILAARAAFHITPEGSSQFKDWLQSIRRSKQCKRELWNAINTALQNNSK